MNPEDKTWYNTSDYFESYEDIDVHESMLRDQPRVKAYQQAIFDNRDEIKDKVILDVGTGTGILAMFCAQAGAAKVYAVEACAVYKIAMDLVKENNLENIITVLNSKVEDLVLPEKVDVIVSEWMGFYLFHEGMLDSVIYARDHFLKPGGLILPEAVTLYSAPCSIPSLWDDWRNVHGTSMTTFAEKLRQKASKGPTIMNVKPEHVLSDPEVVMWVYLKDITVDEINRMKIQHIAVASKAGKYQGVCLWFTCTFPSSTTEPVVLSTEPEEPETHWKQIVIVLPSEVEVEENEPMAYDLLLYRESPLQRSYKMEVTMLDPDVIEHPEYCTCYMTKCILVRAMIDRYDKEAQTRSQSEQLSAQ